MNYESSLFVRDIEQRFNIAVSDIDLERICTLGELCDYLAKRARLFVGAPCATASAFYRLRRLLVDGCDAATTIRPSSPLSSSIALDKRRAVWLAIDRQFGTALPPLRWSLRLRVSWCIFAVAVLTLLPVTWSLAPAGMLALVSASSASLLLLITGYARATQLATVIPPEVATVGAMSQWLANRCLLRTDEPVDSIDDWIWNEVASILSSNAGIARTSLNRNTILTDAT